MMYEVNRVALLVLGLAALPLANADRVYECRDTLGKVTFSNIPCDIQQSPAPTDNATGNYDTFYGRWRGQTQFKETVTGVPNGAAHLITPLTLTIDEGGKVTGTTEDSGCRVLGIARSGPVSTVPNLDLTVSSCMNKVFNRRYTGSLSLYTRQKYATLQLYSLPPSLFGKPATYDMSATLRR
jgi:hypothetical protein